MAEKPPGKFGKRKFTYRCDMWIPGKGPKGLYFDNGTIYGENCGEPGRHYLPGEMAIVDVWYCDEHYWVALESKTRAAEDRTRRLAEKANESGT